MKIMITVEMKSPDSHAKPGASSTCKAWCTNDTKFCGNMGNSVCIIGL